MNEFIINKNVQIKVNGNKPINYVGQLDLMPRGGLIFS